MAAPRSAFDADACRLLMQMSIEAAVMEYRTLVGLGVIVNGTVAPAWLKGHRRLLRTCALIYRTEGDVKELIEFFTGRRLAIALAIAGSHINPEAVRRKLGLTTT